MNLSNKKQMVMAERKYTKEGFIKALMGLANDYKVYVPIRQKDLYEFSLLSGETHPDFDFTNSRLSPKSLVYPQSERMFEYSLNPNDPKANILEETLKDYAPQAIVGIRPCDAYGFSIVKRKFDNPEYRDPWWVKRFESSVLVGLGCNEPCSTCFCASVGGGPFNTDCLDALLYDLGDSFLLTGLTEKGKKFIERLQGGDPADEASTKAAEALAASALEKTNGDVKTDRLKEKAVKGLFEAPFWDNVSFACLNCGICTYMCPTCWCFDIQDEVWGKKGDRIRNWDSCMFPLFTLHGSGHNPRQEKAQRVRQRFMHKLKYYVDKYGDGVQCSGCGRCVRCCPVNIDIRQVAELMNNY